jgi:hypothetical protein
MSSDDRYLNQLKMPPLAAEALARAVPDEVVRDIVRDHYKGPCRRLRLRRTLVGR